MSLAEQPTRGRDYFETLISWGQKKSILVKVITRLQPHARMVDQPHMPEINDKNEQTAINYVVLKFDHLLNQMKCPVLYNNFCMLFRPIRFDDQNTIENTSTKQGLGPS